MKKLFVHLSMLALLAALLVPMTGCKKDEGEVEETPAATTEEATTTTTTTTTEGTTDTGMMSTDMGTSEPMGTEMTPPAQ